VAAAAKRRDDSKRTNAAKGTLAKPSKNPTNIQ